MKKLIRRLSRVTDQYCLLRSVTSTRPNRTYSLRTIKHRRSDRIPEGHLLVYVGEEMDGEEMEWFDFSAQLLNHPIFIRLLNKSAQEYGYEKKGVLHIPCHALVFERVLEALQNGEESHNVQDLLGDEFY